MKWEQISQGLIIGAVVLVTAQSVWADVNLYGYFSLYFEKVGGWYNKDDGSKFEDASPGEFDYANFILMVNSNITDKIRAYACLKGTGGIGLQTYWGEYAFRDFLKLRVGKVYRPFDLYNEKLDAVPTYLGMEPPELFDKDHLMLPRHGKIMLHGGLSVKNDYVRYAYMLDSDENMLSNTADNDVTLSHSWDLNYTFRDIVTIGHSGFFANEKNGSNLLGDLQGGDEPGSPSSGVLPWMASDQYVVVGGYCKVYVKGITFEGAYWHAVHDAVRDPDAVMAVYENASLNAAQLDNFFNSATPSLDAVVTKADFSVQTFYIRLGYTIQMPREMQLTPYFFWDYYSNPETIAQKRWGGDNEAGVADDGVFNKPTWGISFKPKPFIALKIDGSSHLQDINGEATRNSELRMDLSFFFK